jgi:hypothetical protein
MIQFRPFDRWFFAVVLAWGWASVSRASFFRVVDPATDRPAESINFGDKDGNLTGGSPYHTSNQYLEITHTGKDFRKIYVYTDNQAAYGVAGSGLINTEGSPAIPLSFKNYTEKPVNSTVQFTAADVGVWPVLLDRSVNDFDVQKENSLKVSAGPLNLSWVYLGIEVPLGIRPGGNYKANIVIEDFSTAAEVDPPLVKFEQMDGLILMNSDPVGIYLTMEDVSGVEKYSGFYRMQGTSNFQKTEGDPPDQITAFVWEGAVEMDPSFRLDSGVLEYYFEAQDIYVNAVKTPTYATKVFLRGETAEVEYAAGKTSRVGLGDMRRPGLEVQFPDGSVRSPGTLSVRVVDAQTLMKGNMVAAQVVEVGPRDPGLTRPVTLSVPFLDEDGDGKEDTTGSKISNLKLYWHDGFAWRYVGGQVDPQRNQVKASVSRFGTYGVFPDSGVSADSVRPLERILTFNQGNAELIFNTSIQKGPFDIEIYDVRGVVVRKLHNINSWDGRDDGGSRVESGTYVYRFEGQGITLSGMIAVVR